MGAWVQGRPVRTVQRSERWVGHLDRYNSGSTVPTTRRGWAGTAFRKDAETGRFVQDRCGCVHRKLSAAEKCGGRLARFLNDQESS